MLWTKMLKYLLYHLSLDHLVQLGKINKLSTKQNIHGRDFTYVVQSQSLCISLPHAMLKNMEIGLYL